MGLFTDPEVKYLRSEVEKLNKTLATEDFKDRLAYSEEVMELKREVADLEVEKSKREEDFAKERREIEHKIGLEKKRSEQEAKLAVEEAKLAVREENLDAEKSRVKDQMEFMEKRLQQELDSMRDMTAKVMDFIPKVEVDRRIRENYDTRPKELESGTEE